MRFFNWDGLPAVIADDGAALVGNIIDGSVGAGNASALLRDMKAPELSAEAFASMFPKFSAMTRNAGDASSTSP